MKEIIEVKECVIGLQYLFHAVDKCIRSVFNYLSQSNGY